LNLARVRRCVNIWRITSGGSHLADHIWRITAASSAAFFKAFSSALIA